MRVLDLFCCGGGAGRGYAQAGYEVVGVDIVSQLEYPFEFHKADALQFLLEHGKDFNLIHASPPCQGYSNHVTEKNKKPKLISQVRDICEVLEVLYVIENVMGAKESMHNPIVLCGTMFNLPTTRHRLFETNFPVDVPEHPKCRGVAKRFALEKGWEYRDMSVTGKGRRAGTSERWKEILGFPKDSIITQAQLAESIPPAYTCYLGKQAMLWMN